MIRTVCGLLFLLIPVFGYSQSPSFFNSVPSPTAASLGKFGDIPVNLYTGTPQIGIPLGEIESRQLSIPLGLNYHGSGVKVEDIPGWVGLNWALDAGGVITRSLRGLPDEFATGYLSTGTLIEQNWDDLPYNTTGDPNILEQIATNDIDPSPDLFFFNFAGRSGKFVLGTDGQAEIQVIPKQKLKVLFATETSSICNETGVHFSQWTITTENGTKYTFEDLECTDLGANYAFGTSVIASSWFLSRIESATGNDEINFEYSAPVSVTHTIQPYVEEFIEQGCPAIPNVHNDNIFTSKVLYLEKISTANQEITFTHSPRGSGFTSPDEHQLDRISIRRAPAGPIVKGV